LKTVCIFTTTSKILILKPKKNQNSSKSRNKMKCIEVWHKKKNPAQNQRIYEQDSNLQRTLD